MTGWMLATGAALLPVLLNGRMLDRLAMARWTHLRPRAALALWQAIGLGAGLGAVGLGLVAAVAPLAAAFPHGMHTLGRQIVQGQGLQGLGPGHIAGLVWSAALIAWLVTHTAWVCGATLAEQRRLRLLLDVVADPSHTHDFSVIPSPTPIAYCIPGRRSRVVVSSGTFAVLDDQHIEALLGHERTHLKGRHDLLLLPFIALARAFPWLPAARTARQVVPLLLEMLADDRARRVHGDAVLAQALYRMATAGAVTPTRAQAFADTGVVHRVRRLTGKGEHDRQRWAPSVAYASAGVLLSGPVAVLLAPLACVTV
ncbi:hypothetical protein Skr01_48290 [Sphaerisporangium krabiense]|uniref:Peptidase M48 domain-containing protein n=1 Tax=Sphaerisporangium krabiense TaxID=763782 RepID=A0A7W9DNZ5_9ACTN|nr:M56 family metallopeptidase [Sphaerisporangium krabiense]MBB5625941.1 hypothetical protein [Sphaerisporangium krabiense]GII64744.1 hypothetical protein Skr01_48290 [Sphaerisporangium krabiense]